MTKQLTSQVASFLLAAVMTMGALATINTVAEVERHSGFAHAALAQAAATATAKA
jgi:hypothetical protein